MIGDHQVKLVEVEFQDLPFVRHHTVVSMECDVAVRDAAYRHVEPPEEILDVWVLLYIHRKEAGVVGSNKDLLHHDAP